MGRLGLAFRCFFRVMAGKPVPVEALPEQSMPVALPSPIRAELTPELSTQSVIQFLALLQKEGRFLDFLQENIDAYDDAQVGAAVRNIHRDCRKVLQEYLGVDVVVDGQEESPITIPAGFDPSQIRLIGNVTGNPPFSGILKHHGWRATDIKLPQLNKGHDPRVITPAEVEIS